MTKEIIKEVIRYLRKHPSQRKLAKENPWLIWMLYQVRKWQGEDGFDDFITQCEALDSINQEYLSETRDYDDLVSGMNHGGSYGFFVWSDSRHGHDFWEDFFDLFEDFDSHHINKAFKDVAKAL